VADLAAWDVRQANVFGCGESPTGIEPFGRLVQQVMPQSTDRNARRGFWIGDNSASHRGAAAVKRCQSTYPNRIRVHLPGPANWLNQSEIKFSVGQRQVLTPKDFASWPEVEPRH
jgi:hypothetical protein